MSKKTKEKIEAIILQSTGTEGYHRFSIFPNAPVITDGVFALAETAMCYWLLDVIVSYQGNNRLDPSFQVWKLKVFDDNSALVQGYNDTKIIVSQKIFYTDFPLNELKLYLSNGVILLPSEY